MTFAMHTLTLALQTLSDKSIDQRSTVIAECKAHEVVNLKPMWNVYIEALSGHLVTINADHNSKNRSNSAIDKLKSFINNF